MTRRKLFEQRFFTVPYILIHQLREMQQKLWVFVLKVHGLTSMVFHQTDMSKVLEMEGQQKSFVLTQLFCCDVLTKDVSTRI